MAEAPADKADPRVEHETNVAPRHSEAPEAGVGDAEIEIVDVWSRTEPKYRVRATALLLINLALFCGLCVFTYWLREARLFDSSLDSYISPARFWTSGPTLMDFLIEPISVKDTPLHAIVMGLLFGAIFTVPIVISILYRFGSALPFIAAVFVFGHMPWMSLTLLISCVLASLPPFRMKFRYGSALVGLLPVLAYLYLAGAGPRELGLASPTETTLMAMPWVLAILAAAAMIAICLQLAKLLIYRPGAVAPIVSVMFALPVILFHVGVGVDELDYRVLERQYGPRSRAFEPIQDLRPKLQELLLSIVRDEGLYRRYLPEILAALSGESAPNPRLILQYFAVEFHEDRERAYQACNKFIADHPHSRRVPEVLFIQARALDTRLDERPLMAGVLSRKLYFDFPHVQSEQAWSALLKQFPESDLAVAAAVRLAQLRLRAGDAVAASEFLTPLMGRLREQRATTTQPTGGILAPTPTPQTLGFEVGSYQREAWRLEELLRANADDAAYRANPLRELVSLDPHRERYAEQLLRLIDRYSDSVACDNMLVAYAVTLPTPAARAEALDRLVRRKPLGDALPEAKVRLANLEIQSLGGLEHRARGIARLREVAVHSPGTYWGAEARRLLRMYEPTGSEPKP
jgi:hypothetical protein